MQVVMGVLKGKLTFMPEEVKGDFSEVTFEHSLIRFICVHRRLKREIMYQRKTHTYQHTYTSQNMRSFGSSQEMLSS